ncbi:hypothetical protein RRF57_008379 [Xylaria bambusicola]|uniref:Uncharacterized protein n=1 Tax=Xylaria bambusicola TaxID=326684 RepID=A0AAN7UHN0_9PEZI
MRALDRAFYQPAIVSSPIAAANFPQPTRKSAKLGNMVDGTQGRGFLSQEIARRRIGRGASQVWMEFQKEK